MKMKSFQSTIVIMTVAIINVILVLLIIIPRDHHNTANILWENESAYIVERVSETPVSSQSEGELQQIQKGDNYYVTLEKVLVDSSIEGDLLTETYQEFEVYKNQFGEIIHVLPTEYFNYLRYDLNQ
ncbi:hypothetical protein [Chengkuizengella axinellae]|uniref:DUF3221 domain-containing protein n=1 Tax=Chengkuizengella axinellae TaxID=3064388 RepID=A0ABT9J3G3_9BACL|nr:hypothetical protein [Chengkuizengella sp. 2205SS18-9]MDP5275550.1 hypothetical protein [Chengkuizengella sp. 2205SS18-9]